MAQRQEILNHFPSDFLFGVATADHQCEGSGPRWPEDIRDAWERGQKLTLRQAAADFWNRYAEDIENAKESAASSFASQRASDSPRNQGMMTTRSNHA